MPGIKIADASRGLGAKAYGIVVAADIPQQFAELVLTRAVEPVMLVFQKKGGETAFTAPIRDLNGLEVCLVVNRAMNEKKIAFGFRPQDGTAGYAGEDA